MTVLVMLLVAIFFVSGADAASIVMGSLSQRGTLSPSRGVVVFWGVVMGSVAAIMLLVGGDEALTGLQNLTIIAALPFALVMAGLAVALAKDVRSDPVVLRRTAAAEAVEQAVVDGITRHGEDFVLVVEPAPDADRDGIPDTATGSTPLPAAGSAAPAATGRCATSARRSPTRARGSPMAADEFGWSAPSYPRRGRPGPRDAGRHAVRWIFVNLPVSDLAAAKAFYGGLGFGFNEKFSDERTASVVVADNIVVMLLTRDRFADFVPDGAAIGDPAKATTVLNALSAESRQEADDLLARALASGGRPWQPAQDHGFMYGVSFTDPDGHVWEVVWMDPATVQ